MRQASVALVVGLLVLCACSNGAETVSGRYVAKFPFGVEILVLRDDGTYTQIVDIDGKNGSMLHSGKWKRSSSGSQIRLVDPVLLDDEFGRLRNDFLTPVNGIWDLKIRTGLGKISLWWSPDYDYVFERL